MPGIHVAVVLTKTPARVMGKLRPHRRVKLRKVDRGATMTRHGLNGHGAVVNFAGAALVSREVAGGSAADQKPGGNKCEKSRNHTSGRTTRLTDAAPVTLDLEQHCYRGVRCSSLVRLACALVVLTVVCGR